ncbi:CHAT domain-containing protein [Leptolyngbya cf. ectocarpi LEGE 11479]|uniref:CHAT domain-containing protein n=1 Tax=Leptolyngbya cf. ectocarpi LEGE 11479 TaxID=1828722 RepID=A0A928ZRP8_LEPEC|nr:CHAT domain-containing protein [Leptolyngbya ectocarpi]MBE9066868.1 CHAT domain-containing protein [Leptolyngbya cf. ectocarpi LEGE 11479]
MAKWLRFLVVFGLTACLCSQGIPSLAQVTRQVASEQRVAQSTPAQLIQAGRQHYGSGRYVDAIATWQQAAQSYETQNDAVNQASALSNIGLAHLRLGNYEAAQSAIATARNQLNSRPDSPYAQRVLAQVISAQAQLGMAQGDLNAALGYLEQAAELYQNDADGLLRTQLNQSQILQVQGRYREASQQLGDISATLTALDDSALKASGLRRLANTQQFNGEPDKALSSLQESQRTAEAIGNTTELSSTLLSLGNLASENSGSEQLDYPNPDEIYQQAATVAPTLPLRLQAQVNLLGLQIAQNRLDPDLLIQIQAQLPQLSPGRTGNLIRLNLANRLIKAESVWSSEDLTQFLNTTLQQAKASQDGQSQSYAKGYLGGLYENNQQLGAAAVATREAWNLAVATNSTTALYQWQWQLGRILAAQGDTEAAIAAYNQALETLQKLRSDLVSTDTDLQFSFREEVEPIYRELVGLLLRSETGIEGNASKNLINARNVIENLQVAELVNFFRADCVVTNRTEIDQIDTNAAVVYPIILDNSLEVIVSFPGQSSEDSLKHYSIDVEKDIIEQQLDNLQQIISGYPTRNALANLDELRSRSAPNTRAELIPVPIDTNLEDIDFITPAGQVYDWLIRPIEKDLADTDTKMLAFVLDGALRNVPMSVLYDRERSQYLIEQYAIALTPGLQLIDPQPIARRQVKALVAGISEARPDFSQLPNVSIEIQAIQAAVPSDVLENEDFLKDRFAEKLTTLPFPVVHLATHGEFSSNLDETYVLAWDKKINANELSSMLQTGEISRDETIELLILSACETATGDDRAALGLAGIAVRSGARSTLATLWQVNDEGTARLMSDFYQKLSDTSLTKAEILQKVQINLLKNPTYQHPYFWAPFVLIGNWL